jgi:hypothetical protein
MCKACKTAIVVRSHQVASSGENEIFRVWQAKLAFLHETSLLLRAGGHIFLSGGRLTLHLLRQLRRVNYELDTVVDVPRSRRTFPPWRCHLSSSWV